MEEMKINGLAVESLPKPELKAIPETGVGYHANFSQVRIGHFFPLRGIVAYCSGL